MPLNHPVEGPAPSLLADHEPGVHQLLHVVGDGWLGEPHGLDEVADAGLALGMGGDQGQEPDSGGVAECLEHPGQGLCLIGVQNTPRHWGTAELGDVEDRKGGSRGHGSMMPHTLTFFDVSITLDVSPPVDTDEGMTP